MIGLLVGASVLAFSIIDMSYAANESQLVDRFLGICALNLPRLVKIDATASLLGWQPLNADQMTMIGPMDPNAIAKGWLVREKDAAFLVGTSDAVVNNVRTYSCAIAEVNFEQESLVRELSKKLTLRFLDDYPEAGQRYRAWTSEVNTQDLMIILTTLQNPTSSGGTISASVKVR